MSYEQPSHLICLMILSQGHCFPFLNLLLAGSSCFQTWSEAFRGVEDLKEVDLAVHELKEKGVEFPLADPDSIPPIHTPVRVR